MAKESPLAKSLKKIISDLDNFVQDATVLVDQLKKEVPPDDQDLPEIKK